MNKRNHLTKSVSILTTDGIRYVIFPSIVLGRQIFNTILDLHSHWITYIDSNATLEIKDSEG
jgi:hypothetical protein